MVVKMDNEKNRNLKRRIIKAMIADLVMLSKELPDDSTQKEIYSMVHSMLSGHMTLDSLLRVINNNISKHKTVKNYEKHTLPSKTLVKIWEKIRDIIIDAYTEINNIK